VPPSFLEEFRGEVAVLPRYDAVFLASSFPKLTITPARIRAAGGLKAPSEASGPGPARTKKTDSGSPGVGRS